MVTGFLYSYIAGRVQLPPQPKMLDDIETKESRMRTQYIPSRRHTLEVHTLPDT